MENVPGKDGGDSPVGKRDIPGQLGYNRLVLVLTSAQDEDNENRNTKQTVKRITNNDGRGQEVRKNK